MFHGLTNVRMRGKVQNGVDIAKGGSKYAGIPDIPNHHIEPLCQESVARREIVIHANMMTTPSELSRSVATNISCAASYEDIHNDSQAKRIA
jgi:hypothetical protein